MKSLTYEKWEKKYKPIQCKTAEEIHAGASFNGCLYETFGKEYEFIKKQDVHNLWTLVGVEDNMMIYPGYYFANRLGYFVTEKPWTRLTALDA